MTDTHHLDLRGMRCPAPIVKLNTEMRQFTAGATVEAVADDAAFDLDVKAWCRRTGHELIRVDTVGGEITAVIRCQA